MRREEVVDVFLREMQEDALRKLRANDEEYMKNEQRLLKLSEKIAIHIQYLEPELKGVFEKYTI